MPAAQPQGPSGPSRLWVGVRRAAALVTGLLDLLDIIVLAGLTTLLIVALLLGAWQSPIGRFVIIGLLIVVPIFFAIRVRSA